MQYITDTYPPETIKRMEVMDKRCRQAAREYFTKRCEYYRQFTGGSYTRVTIRDQKTRWGAAPPAAPCPSTTGLCLRRPGCWTMWWYMNSAI